jgi:hypothetical protein
LAIFAITKTDGFLITPLSILVKVVYLTPYFLAKSSCDKPCFVRYFFIFYPMLSSLSIFSIILYYVIVILTISAFNIIITNKLKSSKENKIIKSTFMNLLRSAHRRYLLDKIRTYFTQNPNTKF